MFPGIWVVEPQSQHLFDTVTCWRTAVGRMVSAEGYRYSVEVETEHWVENFVIAMEE